MTGVSPAFATLREYVVSHLGGHNFLGIVGDSAHFNGYHLGPYDVAASDYSVQQSRDRAGFTLGNYASALDVGVDWPGSREWFRSLVANRESFPDLVELVGSVDGIRDTYLYRDADGWSTTPWDGSHLTHFHLGWYRDSVNRDHTNVFLTATPVVTVSMTKPVSKPSPVIHAAPSPSPVPLPVKAVSGMFDPRVILWGAGLGAMAWIIKRRMERAHEDSL